MIYIANYGTVLSQAALNAINSFVALSTTPAGSALTKDGSGNFVNTVISSESDTVTSFAFTNGSGFTGTVTNSTTTPTLALTTSLTATSVPFVTTAGALTENALNLTWDDTNLRLKVGSGSTTSAGLYTGYYGSSGYGAIWSTGVTPGLTNFVIATNGATSVLSSGGSGTVEIQTRSGTSTGLFGGSSPGTGVAGAGLYITAGTATTAVNGLSLTQTWNNAGITFTGIKSNITNTASGAGSLLMDLQVASATKFNVTVVGVVTAGNEIRSGDGFQATAAGLIYWNGRGIFSSPAAGTIRHGNTDAASPVAQILEVQNVVAGTSNTAGSNFTIKGSAGTGTGAGGSIIFQVAPAGSTGTSQNALSSVLTLAAPGIATILNPTDSASLQVLNLKGTRATPTASDEIYQSYTLNNSSSAAKEFARITAIASVTTASSEQGRLQLAVQSAGTLTQVITITSTEMYPFTSGAMNLGLSSRPWGTLFLQSGGVINFNNGDVTLTHSSNLLTFAGGQWTFGANTAYFTATDNGNSGTSKTVDWTASNKQKVTLTGNCTFTFTAPGGPSSLVFECIQDGTVRTITWPASVKWAGGTAPTFTGTSGKSDIVTFYYNGTVYYGNYTLNFANS